MTDGERIAVEQARRKRRWDAGTRWQVLLNTITWAMAQGSVHRNTRQARLAEQRQKLLWLADLPEGGLHTLPAGRS